MGTSGEIRRAPKQVRPSIEPRSRTLRELGKFLWRRTRMAREAGNTPAQSEAAVLAGEQLATDAARRRKTSKSESGYAAYGDFIKDELEAQDKRKASFEQRGLAVITTSGALVTLLFALAALST
ncbi:MAG TPA: hypothetical protein VF521_08555, partial [Pyrinomonadaceae bacterium]